MHDRGIGVRCYMEAFWKQHYKEVVLLHGDAICMGENSSFKQTMPHYNTYSHIKSVYFVRNVTIKADLLLFLNISN